MINTKIVVNDPWYAHLLDMTAGFSYISDDFIDHIGIAIASFCKQHNILLITQNDLSLLASRSFNAMGYTDVAKRILEENNLYKNHAEAWVQSFESIGQFSSMFPFFTRGVIIPYSWLGSSNHRMWELNLKRLSVAENELHELMIYQSVQKLIKMIMPLWDRSFGKGILGINGLRSSALKNLFCSDNFNHAIDLASLASDIFAEYQHTRNWKAIPDIMIL